MDWKSFRALLLEDYYLLIWYRFVFWSLYTPTKQWWTFIASVNLNSIYRINAMYKSNFWMKVSSVIKLNWIKMYRLIDFGFQNIVFPIIDILFKIKLISTHLWGPLRLKLHILYCPFVSLFNTKYLFISLCQVITNKTVLHQKHYFSKRKCFQKIGFLFEHERISNNISAIIRQIECSKESTVHNFYKTFSISSRLHNFNSCRAQQGLSFKLPIPGIWQ